MKINLRLPTIKPLFSMELKISNLFIIYFTCNTFPFKMSETCQTELLCIESTFSAQQKLKFLFNLLSRILINLVKGLFLFKSSLIDVITIDRNQMTRFLVGFLWFVTVWQLDCVWQFFPFSHLPYVLHFVGIFRKNGSYYFIFWAKRKEYAKGLSYICDNI